MLKTVSKNSSSRPAPPSASKARGGSLTYPQSPSAAPLSPRALSPWSLSEWVLPYPPPMLPPPINSRVHHHVEIGLGSTLVASALPDSLLTYGDKFLFALFTAVCTSVISALIQNRLRKSPK